HEGGNNQVAHDEKEEIEREDEDQAMMADGKDEAFVKAGMGIRVLDLSRVLAGPYCSMLLADMGADVIKLELPISGDDSRQFPPFKDGQSLYYVNLNRFVHYPFTSSPSPSSPFSFAIYGGFFCSPTP